MVLVAQAKLNDKKGLANIVKESATQGASAAQALLQPSVEVDAEDSDEEDADAADNLSFCGDAGPDLFRKRKPQPDLNADGSKRAKTGKQQQDNKQVKGAVYSKLEAQGFSKEIQSIGSTDEKRLKCAADDIIECINFIFEKEFTAYDRQTSNQAIMRAKSLCFSLWGEFLWSGAVSMNGKKFKAYSGLRPELQHVARLAREKITVSEGEKKDPLEIAQELTQELLEQPVTMVVEGDDDSRARIAAFLQRQDQVAKINNFIDHVLDLPTGMHEPMISSLKFAVGKTLPLVDFLSAVEKNVESLLPAQWLSFATDVSDYYAANGGFATGCEKADSKSGQHGRYQIVSHLFWHMNIIWMNGYEHVYEWMQIMTFHHGYINRLNTQFFFGRLMADADAKLTHWIRPRIRPMPAHVSNGCLVWLYAHTHTS